MGERKLVRDLMSVGVPTCAMQASLQQVAGILVNSDIDCVVVIDPEGHAVGVVSQDDLVKAYSQEGWDQLTAEEVMQENVPQVPPDLLLTAAAQLMRDQHARSLFVMHHAGGIIYSAAVLTYRHILRHMAAKDDAELKDLGNQAARKGPLETFIERRDAARQKLISRTEET